jgi:hypothetical protein
MTINEEVKALLASPQAIFLPAKVKTIVQVLADTVNALEGRVSALELKKGN